MSRLCGGRSGIESSEEADGTRLRRLSLTLAEPDLDLDLDREDCLSPSKSWLLSASRCWRLMSISCSTIQPALACRPSTLSLTISLRFASLRTSRS